jgi:hypothetical protein
MALADTEMFVPLMERTGTSEVARSHRGFYTAFREAGGPKKLGRTHRDTPGRGSGYMWWERRNEFVARHLGQANKNNEKMWKPDGEPTKRHLGLIAWAYTPDPKGVKRWISRNANENPKPEKPFDCYGVPRRPGVECRNYGPSYPVETRAEYLQWIKACRKLAERDPEKAVALGCKREAHIVLSGGRDKSRFPERKAPSISLNTAKRLAFGKDMGGPWGSRSQSPAVHAYTDRLAKDKKSDIKAIRDAIADYQATTPKVAGGHGFRVPLSPEPLIERGMPSRAARILVFRARDRIFLLPLEHSKFTEDVTGKPRIDYKNLSNINLFDLPAVLDRISRRRAKKGLKRQPRDQEIAVSNPFDYDYDDLFTDVKANPRHRRKSHKNRPVPWKGAKGQFSVQQRKHQGHQPANRKNPIEPLFLVFAKHVKTNKRAGQKVTTHMLRAPADLSKREAIKAAKAYAKRQSSPHMVLGFTGWMGAEDAGYAGFTVSNTKVMGARKNPRPKGRKQRPVPWKGAKGQFSTTQRKHRGYQPINRKNPADLSEAQIMAGFGGAEARDNLARENGRHHGRHLPAPWRGAKGQFSINQRKRLGYHPANRKNPRDLSEAQIAAGFGGAEARDNLARTNGESPWGYDMPPGYPYSQGKGQYGTYRAVPPTNRRNPAKLKWTKFSDGAWISNIGNYIIVPAGRSGFFELMQHDGTEWQSIGSHYMSAAHMKLQAKIHFERS